jgi:hypothetical protein
MINATPKELRRAADIQERIQSLQSELDKILGTLAETATETPRKRKFSAAARAKMRKAQKARWARIKGAAPSAKPAKRGKRKMSVAGRAAISAAAKARWAKAKKAGKTHL